MEARYDIQLNSDLSRTIENGDFVIDRSDRQHSKLIVKAFKGELRRNPAIGFGAIKWLKRTIRGASELEGAVKREHEKDGYEPQVSFKDGKLNIEL